MKIQVTPTPEQVVAALAIVWGCQPDDILTVATADVDQPDDIRTAYEITTDVKGINKAERAIAKLKGG